MYFLHPAINVQFTLAHISFFQSALKRVLLYNSVSGSFDKKGMKMPFFN
jgi:hypothetical protein